MSNTFPQRISIIGLGRLGAPIAAALASRGFDVIGVDTDPHKVDAINRGQAPVFETGLEELLVEARPRLRATTDVIRAVRETEVSFILVPTPSDRDGGFSLRHVEPACERIGRAMALEDRFHLVVLVSTVMPGATGGPVLEVLTQTSGRTAGRDFGLCYSPEFIAIGNVIEGLINPDLFLIGEYDGRSGDALSGIYRQVWRKHAGRKTSRRPPRGCRHPGRATPRRPDSPAGASRHP